MDSRLLKERNPGCWKKLERNEQDGRIWGTFLRLAIYYLTRVQHPYGICLCVSACVGIIANQLPLQGARTFSVYRRNRWNGTISTMVSGVSLYCLITISYCQMEQHYIFLLHRSYEVPINRVFTPQHLQAWLGQVEINPILLYSCHLYLTL